MMARACLIAFCFLTLPWRTAGAIEFPVPRGPSREPKPYRHDVKLVERLPRVFLEEASAVILYSGTSHIVEEDGTVETVTHEITRFNGRKGIESYGEFRSIYYDPSYQKLTLNEARVLKKNGTIVQVEPRHVHLRDASTDFQVYDSDKQLVISFPSLEVGDAYEVKWTVRGRNREFEGEFFTRYNFGDQRIPIVLDELHVSLPRGKPFHHACVNGTLEPTRRDEKGRKHFHWHVKERWPTAAEEDRPSRELLKLQVICSTFRNWEAVAAWKEKLRKDCWECDASVRKVVKDLTTGMSQATDKAKALTYWVRRNIRYLSRGPAGTGYTPHRPAQVLGNLFGDCKDQAQLLAVMLREIGLDPHLVTLGVLDDGQVIEAVPCPWGTHGILMVTIDGKEHWIDTTITMAPWDWLPRADRDRMAYLTRRGEITLKRTPPYTAADNRYEQTTYVAVQGDGTSHCTRSMFFHGGVALGRRESWIEATPGERRRYLTNELQDSYPRCRLEGIDIPERSLTDWDKSVQALVRFVVPKHFSGETSKEASVTDSPVWGRIIAYRPGEERTLPLNLGSPFESLHLYAIQLPPTHRFDGLPRDKEVTSPWGSFRLSVKPVDRNPRRLDLVMHTKLTRTNVEPKEFAEFRKFADELARSYRVWLYTKPTSDIEDAPLLEALFAFAPGSDAFAARTLAKLYQDHERWADARRVLDVATTYHSADLELWTLRLKVAKNAADTERVYESLVRYFPDQPKYALGLGEERMKRSEFAAARKVLAPLTRHASREVRSQAYYELAKLCMRQGQLGPAALHWEAAGQLDPETVAGGEALRFAADLHEKRGDDDEAIRAYVGALKSDPGDAVTLARLIRLECKLGRELDALDHMRRLVMAAKGNVTRLIQAAEVYYEMQRWDEAMEIALRAREAGFQGRVQRLLGLLHFQKNEWEKAIFHLERGDQDAAALEALLQSHLARGQLPEAHRLLETIGRLTKSTPSLSEWEAELRNLTQAHKRLMASDVGKAGSAKRSRAVSLYLCADLAWRKGQPRERVETLLLQALEGNAEIAPAYGLRALMSLEAGLLRKANEDVEKALALSKGDARIFYVRGRMRFEKGQPGAVEDLTRAATLSDEKDATILHWLASALNQAGRLDEAVAAQRKAVALRPRDGALAEQLAALERAKRER